MRSYRYRPPGRRRWKWKLRITLLLGGVIALYFVCMAYIRPMILDYVENMVVHEATFALFDVLTDEVYTHREEYAGLVTLERDADQAVTALKTDGILANRLKVRVSRAIYEALDELERTAVTVPIGTILFPDFLAGRGPSLHVGVAGLGYSQAEFISAFTAEGINQTRHQILLESVAQIRVMTIFGGRDSEVRNRLVVSDTVIVGRVPDQYTYIDDTEQSLLGKINDYAE